MQRSVIGEDRAGDIRHCTAEWLEPRLDNDRGDEMMWQLTERSLSR
jgi:hypothetical protein